MFKKILIANRGEIAVRIIRACREMGICSAALYSDADRTSLHAKLADESYHIGSSVSNDSYLNQDKIIKLAKKIGADAIHPGYGFFSENSDFIRAVEKEKIKFIGPSSKSVLLMGSKTSARKLMKKNKVPIVSGTTEPLQSVDEGISISKELGYPVLLKASAGGGGKGMRKINSAKEFESAYDAARRESKKAFASDEVYLEKFIEKPRHIEVQIIADKKGNYCHLFERECSIQRRHQKIIEEAPSVFVDDQTRKKITQAAINAAKACEYFNAGTIEFLMDSKKNFYFLEMNTRLQVEHPVTEMITGIDLVKEQISIAVGNTISFSQSEIKMNGHAIECRIYAEDAYNNFLPSSGKIYHHNPPAGPGIRLDSGFEPGSEISLYYDPMISKLICWAKDRDSAIQRMQRALFEYRIAGVITNINFLKSVIGHSKFKKGEFDINFIDEKFMNSLQKNEKDKRYDSLQDAAVIFSAIFKSETSSPHYSINSNHHNTWQEQMYE